MTTVADIMSPVVGTIADTATIADAIQVMRQTELRSLIVEQQRLDTPYGIVTERDIVYKVIARKHDPTRVLVHDIMRQPCIAVEPDLSVFELAQLFSDTGIQRAPVLQNGQLLGVVSVTDILMKSSSVPAAI